MVAYPILIMSTKANRKSFEKIAVFESVSDKNCRQLAKLHRLNTLQPGLSISTYVALTIAEKLLIFYLKSKMLLIPIRLDYVTSSKFIKK